MRLTHLRGSVHLIARLPVPVLVKILSIVETDAMIAKNIAEKQAVKGST